MAIFSEYVLREALKKICHGLPVAKNTYFHDASALRIKTDFHWIFYICTKAFLPDIFHQVTRPAAVRLKRNNGLSVPILTAYKSKDSRSYAIPPCRSPQYDDIIVTDTNAKGLDRRFVTAVHFMLPLLYHLIIRAGIVIFRFNARHICMKTVSSHFGNFPGIAV